MTDKLNRIDSYHAAYKFIEKLAAYADMDGYDSVAVPIGYYHVSDAGNEARELLTKLVPPV